MKKIKFSDIDTTSIIETYAKKYIKPTIDLKNEIDINQILLILNYRKISKTIWVKPFGATLIVIDFIDTGVRMTQWFLNMNNVMCIWNSKTFVKDSIISYKTIQGYECEICKDAMLGFNSDYEKIIPHLSSIDLLINEL